MLYLKDYNETSVQTIALHILHTVGIWVRHLLKVPINLIQLWAKFEPSLWRVTGSFRWLSHWRRIYDGSIVYRVNIACQLMYTNLPLAFKCFNNYSLSLRPWSLNSQTAWKPNGAVIRSSFRYVHSTCTLFLHSMKRHFSNNHFAYHKNSANLPQPLAWHLPFAAFGALDQALRSFEKS